MWLSNRRVWLLTGLITLAGLIPSPGHAQVPLSVVPGAFGFGMTTRAAYGGSVPPTVYRVTNLNDSGTGSLRSALEGTLGPRVVIFETSGTIRLASQIHITSPYLTIAGQTAPSPGIMLTVHGLWVDTHDVLIQHLRLRMGAGASLPGCENDIEVSTASTNGPYNIVFDHLSASWSQHIPIGISSRISGTNANITIWRSFATEGLRPNVNSTSPCNNSFGILSAYSGTHYVSTLQSLMAHNNDRNSTQQDDTITYSANNLIYDFGLGTRFTADNASAPDPNVLGTAIGNYYKTGPWTGPVNNNGNAIDADWLATGSKLYLADNIVDDSPQYRISLYGFYRGIDPTIGVSSSPTPVPGYIPMAGSDTYAFVLANAGARPLDRDSVDLRIVNEVKTRTGQMISSETDVGGWPMLAINSRALTTPANPHTVTTSGYTNLEIWLHGYAAAVEGGTHPPAAATNVSMQ
jgi:hypothetical protein